MGGLMDSDNMVSAEEARGLLAPGDVYDDAVAIAMLEPLAHTVIALHARAERAERERDEAIDLLEGIPTWGPYRWRDVPETVRLKLRGNSDQIGRLIKERDAARTLLDGEVGANMRWAAQAEHALLRRLWQRIDGDQDGDAPSTAAMEEGLVRLFDDMRADVERCAADENASTEEAERMKAERDRLARVLAVERGDAGEAPEGWRRNQHGAWLLGRWSVARLDAGRWGVSPPGTMACTNVYPTALEAMEAADAAREGSDG